MSSRIAITIMRIRAQHHPLHAVGKQSAEQTASENGDGSEKTEKSKNDVQAADNLDVRRHDVCV